MHINHESPAFTTNGCKWVQDQPELYPQVPKVGWTGLDRAFYRLFSEKSTPKTRFLLQFQCNMHVYRPAIFFTYSWTWLTSFSTQIIKIGDPRCSATYTVYDILYTKEVITCRHMMHMIFSILWFWSTFNDWDSIFSMVRFRSISNCSNGPKSQSRRDRMWTKIVKSRILKSRDHK